MLTAVKVNTVNFKSGSLLTSYRDVESGDRRRDVGDVEDRLAVSETSELTEALPSSSNVVGISLASFNTQIVSFG